MGAPYGAPTQVTVTDPQTGKTTTMTYGPAAQAYQQPAQPQQQMQPQQPPGVQMNALKCSACGAPFEPEGGMSVVTCEYCGTATVLSGLGWKQVRSHVMVLNSIDESAALETAGLWLNEGLLRRKVAERSEVSGAKLKYVPYWVIPATARTELTGLKGLGVAQAREGGAKGLLKGIGTFAAYKTFGGGPKRTSDSIYNSYNFPVVALRGFQSYQVEDYQFNLVGKQKYDKKMLSSGGEVMNGDVNEEEAREMAKGLIHQLQEKVARTRMDRVDSIRTDIQTQEGELLHAPVWFMEYRFKEFNGSILVDGSMRKVMTGQRPGWAL